ncbi:suppressor for copper-sensitivity B [Vibrio inusitatus NBRC 102082]|uniref:Suppressor for copper-sensitivity B n=1 Tax=Vibrio inusitatus NBRC 102082 TaxID=1219070 RepID=A0A4Y3HSM6_9VIBR|nr:protein-disulfide reductase DsbD domain-containing protein [Vibrio inusitatus]GEA50015.1 suppressor for copper-sensitivity B [Vibrio inusitatus NBRC 102082]
MLKTKFITHTLLKPLLSGLLFLWATSFVQVVFASEVSSGWITSPDHPPVQVRFDLTGQTNSDMHTVEGLLEVKLDDGWKTYWRTAGEAGVAPSIDYTASTNIESLKWHWPFPERFSLLGIETLGYQSDVLFPITLHLNDFSQPTTLNATLTLPSCTTICVLTDYPISLSFVANDLNTNDQAMLSYAKAISSVPKDSPLLSYIDATWDKASSKLEVNVTKTTPWHAPDVLIDGKAENVEDASFKKPSLTVDGNTLHAVFEVTSWLGTPSLENEIVSISFSDSDFLAEEQVAVSTGVVSSITPSLLQMFIFAVIGGLILNIMPCVLPVLGMKLSSIVSMQGQERRKIRWQFIASALGILVSFWSIALFLAIVKLSGGALGWGIQFQSPWFLSFLFVVTALFAMNMLGLMEVRLSSGISTWLAGKGDNSYSGHFIQGMFATLLATPCTAPFLGTAVAFALGADISTLFVIFSALALGMALPWLLVATFPSIATKLPKPGPWMNKMKLLFGLMMLATSIWLLSLLGNHLSLLWIILIGLSLFCMLIFKSQSAYGKNVAAVVAVIGIVASGGGLITASVTADNWATPLPVERQWHLLSTPDIEKYVAEGKVVFVDITADWCITCKANKIGVLLQEPVYSTLDNTNVIRMKGDWTRPSDRVTGFLRSYNRYGVPFNIVYGPNAPQGIALPTVLSTAPVQTAIEKAGGEF